MAQFYEAKEIGVKIEKDLIYHYEIGLNDNHICKMYKCDYSLTSVIDEFVRFFIYLDLDQFMRDNDFT